MLNIKNRKTEEAVRKLAERLDVTLTEAIAVAVRHEIERLDGDREHYLAQVGEAAREVRAKFNPADWLDEDALYDDSGVPR